MVSYDKFSDEDVSYLEEWCLNLQEIARNVKKNALQKNLTTFFSITSTFQYGIIKPYITPIRILESGLIFGVVIYSPTQAIIAGNIMKDIADEILVDAEKKVDSEIKNGAQIDVNHSLLNYFNVRLSDKQLVSLNKANINNISSAVRIVVSDIKITEFKPNDITVDAVWTFLSLKLNTFHGKKIAIIGCGNIGFKLALKLAESGVKVVIVRRNQDKGKFMAEAINLLTPLSDSPVKYCHSALDASDECDVLIGAATQVTRVISSDMIKNISPNGFVIDIGKGNLEDTAINLALKTNIDIFRGDITGSLYGYISHMQKMKNVIENKTGRINLNSSISLISGGLLGKEGEIVVDNFESPSIIYGVSNGLGSIKIHLDAIDKENLTNLKKLYDIL